MTVRESPLDDPANAAFAFTRFKRMMKWMAAFTVLIDAVVLIGLWLTSEQVSIHFYIATALGVGFTSMLTGALMGLMFLSNGTGHDASIADPFDGKPWPGTGSEND